MTHQKTSPASTAMPSEAKDNTGRQQYSTAYRPLSTYPDVIPLDVLRECRQRWVRNGRYARVMGDKGGQIIAAGWVRLYDRRIERVTKWMEETA